MYLRTNASRELSINHECQGALVIVTLSGFMTQLEFNKVKNHCEALIKDDKGLMILDLSRLSYIDSAGIGTLMQLRNECQKVHGKLMIVEPQTGAVQNSLRLAHLQKVIDFWPDVESARRALSENHGLAEPEKADTPEQRMGRLEEQIRAQEETVRQMVARLGRMEDLILALSTRG